MTSSGENVGRRSIHHRCLGCRRASQIRSGADAAVRKRPHAYRERGKTRSFTAARKRRRARDRRRANASVARGLSAAEVINLSALISVLRGGDSRDRNPPAAVARDSVLPAALSRASYTRELSQSRPPGVSVTRRTATSRTRRGNYRWSHESPGRVECGEKFFSATCLVAKNERVANVVEEFFF